MTRSPSVRVPRRDAANTPISMPSPITSSVDTVTRISVLPNALTTIGPTDV